VQSKNTSKHVELLCSMLQKFPPQNMRCSQNYKLIVCHLQMTMVCENSSHQLPRNCDLVIVLLQEIPDAHSLHLTLKKKVWIELLRLSKYRLFQLQASFIEFVLRNDSTCRRSVLEEAFGFALFEQALDSPKSSTTNLQTRFQHNFDCSIQIVRSHATFLTPVVSRLCVVSTLCAPTPHS